MKVLSTATTTESGKISFDGKPLTGTVYELGSDHETIAAEHSVLDGCIVATDVRRGAVPRCVVREPMDMPEHTGSSFSGVSFSFSEDGRLVDEFSYRDGVSVGPYSIWHASGAIAKYAENVDSADEWLEDGMLSSVTREGLFAGYDHAAKLVALRLGDRYSAETLCRLPLSVGSRLHLSGSGITDATLTQLIGADQMITLSLEGTRISVLGLRALCRANVTTLTTLGNELPKEVIESVADSLPNCRWLHAEPDPENEDSADDVDWRIQ